ncbi:MAG: PEP-CTERM sorting domain-containing protein [Verrucomicrobiota bacterium]
MKNLAAQAGHGSKTRRGSLIRPVCSQQPTRNRAFGPTKKRANMKKIILGAFCALALAGTVPAVAGTFEPEPGFSSTNVNTGVGTDLQIVSFDAVGDTLYNWQGDPAFFGQGGGLFIGDFQGNGTPVVVNDPSDPTLNSDYISTAFNSFTTYHEASNTLWLGFTISGNADDRIYTVDLDTNTWSRQGENADFTGNYDLQFSGGEIYVSALGSSGSGNSIWHFDPTINNSTALTEIVNPGGNSAGLTFDDEGNLYYGTNGLADDVIYQFSADEVETALNTDTPITVTNSQIITNVDSGVTDVVVDDENQLFFNFNFAGDDFDESYLALWNGIAGQDDNFELLGQAFSDPFTFLTGLDANGSFEQGGPVLALEAASGDLFAVVPEPTSGALLGLALLSGLALRRSRRS